MQPVYSHDVGKALMAIVDGHEDYAGRTFQLTGPAEYNYKEVAEYVSDVTTQRTKLVDVPPMLASKLGSFVEELVSPVLTADMVCTRTGSFCTTDVKLSFIALFRILCLSIFD